MTVPIFLRNNKNRYYSHLPLTPGLPGLPIMPGGPGIPNGPIIPGSPLGPVERKQ